MKKIGVRLVVFGCLFVLALGVTAQNANISGVVMDDMNITIPGASVVVKGTTLGTITDIDGNFSLPVPADAEVIVVSFIGYTTQELVLDGKTSNYQIKLETSSIGLDEVVAVGYGSVKKSDLTGAVASLDSDNLTEMRKTDAAQAIQGRVAGVDVSRLSSKPGAPMSIKIRGNSVITNPNSAGRDGVSSDPMDDLSSPLYVVDGIFMDDISVVNPSDISKMDILKDASATAIYGSRGANGVVIITTKSGIEGKTQFTYDGSFGVNTATNIPDMMTGDEYVAFIDDYARATEWQSLVNNGNGTADAYNAIDPDFSTYFVGEDEQANVANREYTDWAGDYRKVGIQTSHSVGMSGGSNGLVFSGSLGYMKDEGVIGIEAYERYNAGLSLSKKVTDVVTVGMKTYVTYSDREEGSSELFRSTLRLAPTLSSTDENGEFIVSPDLADTRFIHPEYEAEGAWTVNTRKYNVSANFYVDIKPVEWFNFKSTFSPNLTNSRYGEYRGLLTKSSRNDETRTRAYYETDFSNAYTWDNIANFDFNIIEGHDMKATVISSLYSRQQEGSAIQNRDFDSDQYSYYSIGAGTDKQSATSYYTKQTIASFAARLNYNIQEKYLFTFTGRYDGSSKLAEGHKWNFFPSTAFAWRVNQEDFMYGVDWIDNLKLRVSYGESGNDKSVSPYASMAFLSDANYLFGDTGAKGKVVTGLSNDQLGWETSKEYNIGFDLGVLRNRVRFSFEYYNKKTVDSILDRDLMWLSGYSSAMGNFGSVRNKGVEMVLNTANIAEGDFKWSTSFNFAKNVNEIVAIDGDTETIFPSNDDHGILRVGEAVDAIYAYEKVGIWQLDEIEEAAVYNSVPGQYKFTDQNEDGVIDTDDKVVIGTRSPQWTGGMTNNFSYKNFDFSVMVYTRQGVMGHSEFYQNFGTYTAESDFNKLDMDYWTPNNTGGEFAMPIMGDTGDAKDLGDGGGYHYVDMSFVKVGNIGLGYQVPALALEKFKISNCRLSLDVQNPFTFTDYQGPDPETGLQNSYGMAYSVRTILFGVKITL